MDFWGQTIFLWIVHQGDWITFSSPDNRYAHGQSAVEVIRELIGFAWSPDVMVRLFAGDPLYIGIDKPNVRISRDEGYFLLDVEDERTQVRYLIWVGYGDVPVRSLLVTAPADSPYGEGMQVEYSRYKTVDGIDFPFSAVVSAPCRDCDLVVDYESLMLNCSLEEGIFSFPPPAPMDQYKR
jgi:hypothetical protein